MSGKPTGVKGGLEIIYIMNIINLTIIDLIVVPGNVKHVTTASKRLETAFQQIALVLPHDIANRQDSVTL